MISAVPSPVRLANSEELRTFHDVAKALTSSLDLDQVLQTILDKMATFFRPDNWSLLIVDPKEQALSCAIAVGESSQKQKAAKVPIGEGIAGWVAAHGEPLIVSDMQSDPRFRISGSPHKAVTHSMICLPLKSKDVVLGVIQLVNCHVDSFSDRELFLLHALCDYAAIAIDNAKSVEKIQELTITDDVTGLYNARHLYKVLETEESRCRRNAQEFSVIFMDMDHFKSVNDQHGHLVGTRLLAEIGYRIKSHLRLIDYAFRYGGDEFVIVLPQTGVDAALAVAKRVQQSFREEPFLRDEGVSVIVKSSIGIACYPQDAKSANDIIVRADEQMYAVKNTTRDAIAVAGLGHIG